MLCIKQPFFSRMEGFFTCFINFCIIAWLKSWIKANLWNFFPDDIQFQLLLYVATNIALGLSQSHCGKKNWNAKREINCATSHLYLFERLVCFHCFCFDSKAQELYVLKIDLYIQKQEILESKVEGMHSK